MTQVSVGEGFPSPTAKCVGAQRERGRAHRGLLCLLVLIPPKPLGSLKILSQSQRLLFGKPAEPWGRWHPTKKGLALNRHGTGPPGQVA